MEGIHHYVTDSSVVGLVPRVPKRSLFSFSPAVTGEDIQRKHEKAVSVNQSAMFELPAKRVRMGMNRAASCVG